MDTTRFDTVAKLFAGRRLSRRRALAGGGAGLDAGALAATGLAGAARAQDATPPAEGAAEQKTEFLFVQSFQSGSLAPKDGEDGTYTLTLAQGLGQTLYFSDRPDRIVGATPTAGFLQTFPFGAANPPNAALVLEAAPGDTDVVVVKLTAPTYDEATKTATYDATLLADYEKLGITFQEAPKGAAEVTPQFGAASLFIDDCPNGNLFCQNINTLAQWLIASNSGFCYNPSRVCCGPCEGYEYWAQQCQGTLAQECNGQCTVVTDERLLACPNG
jgi:hypothetical protein